MKFLSWLISCAVISIVIGSSAVLVQQNIRMGADEVLVQIAGDVAQSIAQGSLPINVVPTGSVDPRRSLATFVTIYDDKGVVIASSMDVDNLVPSPPVGVFDKTWEDGHYRVTWQPIAGARIAAVLERVKDKQQFVLAGRSLREVESRINTLMLIALFAWLASLILVTIKVFIDRNSPEHPIFQPPQTLAKKTIEHIQKN